ncbi:uncharacterized protein LOC120623417 [Pararge aegeria]|uniref:uncharacterized protein LOC120623417 n=1 Tax=Pararge aegeria TaxID=116150 RepID=UPI0019D02322|nr:uncharacterized protein LOC120623417 [Pararge aegeria]
MEISTASNHVLPRKRSRNKSLFTHIQIIAAVIGVSYALEPKTDDEDIQKVLAKYFKKVPDIHSSYVVNEQLAKTIANYFNGTVNAFPLFRISIKIDRKPIKIPWTLNHGTRVNDTLMKKRYKYIKIRK